MSRRLTAVLVAMLVLTGAMGLKTLVAAQDHGAVMMANGPAFPPPQLNGPAFPPPQFLNGPAFPPPQRLNGPAFPPPQRAQ
jgi:hypothetical protein